MARLQASQISFFSFPLPNRLLTIELVVSEKSKNSHKEASIDTPHDIGYRQGRSPQMFDSNKKQEPL